MSDIADRVKKIVVEHLGVEEAKVDRQGRDRVHRQGEDLIGRARAACAASSSPDWVWSPRWVAG
jgi:hypothetical protein